MTETADIRKRKEPPEGLMTVSEFAKTYTTRRGFSPVDVSYIYKLIKQHQAGKKETIPFEYKLIDRQIYIVK